MLKTLLKLGITLTLLIGCYFGYERAFKLVLVRFEVERFDRGNLFVIHSTQSKLEAKRLAELAFGRDHWTVTDERPFAYYNSQRGFWMYWQDYEEIQEENGVRYDGKRVRMRPFAMIGRSGDGKSIWRLIGNEAILDLNQPIGISKQNSDGIKVEHAVIERDVRIRDDRGTPELTADDMNIGPLTYLEYDDAKHLITTTSHFVMQDPDQTTIGDELTLQLRVRDPGLATTQGGSSSGFGGADYAILHKKVSVAMRDVGNSGVFSGGTSKPKAASKPASASTATATVKAPGAADPKAATPAEPVPMYVQSAGPMRIDFPPDTVPVPVGPPAPPKPTLVRFDRDVVALHGRRDDQPNQLDCDVLRLTLIPASPPPAPDKDRRKDRAKPEDKGAPPATAVAATDARPGPDGKPGPDGGKPGPDGGKPEDAATKQGLFGNLTLQKAHATGHAVWLQLRKQSAKVRCVEMIHVREAPDRPDSTFFRGEKTRQVWLEKIDYEDDEEQKPEKVADGRATAPAAKAADRPRKVKSVTFVRTLSAKLFDRGNGLDLVDVRAFGPGRLESRPDLGQPVERIAEWQDELTIVNLLTPDGKLRQKRLTLTGTRPFFVDLAKKTSLDSAKEIRVFLRPRTEPTTPAAPATAGPPTHVVARPPAPSGEPAASGTGSSSDGAGGDMGLGGGSLQVERILAYRDVHFKAPNKYMEARSWLDAPFIEVDPPPPAEKSTESPAEGPPAPETPKPAEPGAPAPAPAPEKEAPPEPAEPAMTAVADRIWAKVAIPRGQALDPSKDRRKKSGAKPAATPPQSPSTDDPEGLPTVTVAKAEEPKDGAADIREAFLRGNVAIHQDKPPDPSKKDKPKPKGDDVCGEAVWLDNKGEGKINAMVWNSDPIDKTPVIGPVRFAKVSNDDMIIYGQILWMVQEHDQLYAFGPGSMSQWTDRSMMSDKAPESKPPAEGGGGAATMAARTPAKEVKAEAPAKPKTRAGVPIAEKDLLTISWTDSMEFNGRTKDTAGHPAGRADFYGIVDANMTDARLHCNQKMIVFTDREVPLRDLGTSTNRKGPAADGPDEPALPEGDENIEREAPEKSRVNIAMIYCYGEPSAINRKVHPDAQAVTEQEKIVAWDYRLSSQRDGRTLRPGRLDYNRLTGEFYVPGPGMVFLYNRDKGKPKQDETGGTKGEAPVGRPEDGTTRRPPRTVLPTSSRTANRADRASANPGKPAGPASPPVSVKLEPLILMQVKFRDGMKGRMGVGQADDKRQERWSQFFGDIEFLRSEVANQNVILNPDARLSADGFFLTSQMLRIIQEPPPPGSPEDAPARSFAKAWEQVHVNRGEAFAIESDVTTFDSEYDLLWAYGENGHGVSLMHQGGPGQPPSTSTARAVQYNVKTHVWSEVEGSNFMIIDHRTGARPVPVSIPDPTAPPKPKVKQPFKVPNTNLERRGFTGY